MSVGNVTVIAVLSAAGVADVTVPYTVSGTAASPADHDLVGGSIVILAGNLNGSVSFNVVSDTMDENNETVVLTMGAPTNAVPGATTVHTATITDDDVAPVVNWSGPSQTVGEAVGPVTVTATLSTVSGLDVTVPYAVSGTAANPEDHDLANGSVVILAGNLNGSVAFNVVNDVMSEVDETVIVTMGAPTNATLGATTVHTVTITDDDAGPGMVLHYEFDDVADGTAVDTSGNANDGAVTPPDTRPAGRIGQALDLDGSTTKVTSATAASPAAS